MLSGILERGSKCFCCHQKIKLEDDSKLIHLAVVDNPKYSDLKIQHCIIPNEYVELDAKYCKEIFDNYLLKRTKSACVLCGEKFKLISDEKDWNIEHIIAFSEGGKYDNFNNLGPAHKSCNSAKADLPLLQNVKKLIKDDESRRDKIIDVLNSLKQKQSIRRTTKRRIKEAVLAANRRSTKLKKRKNKDKIKYNKNNHEEMKRGHSTAETQKKRNKGR